MGGENFLFRSQILLYDPISRTRVYNSRNYELSTKSTLDNPFTRLLSTQTYSNVFIESFTDLHGPSPFLIPYDLETGAAPPHTQKPLKMSKALGNQLLERINELETGGIIQPAKLNWSQRVVLVPKNNHDPSKGVRVCSGF
jgi:hypothetical protein